MQSRDGWLVLAIALGGCGTSSPASAPPVELCTGGEVSPGVWADFARSFEAHVCYAGNDGLEARLWQVPLEPTLGRIDAYALRAGWAARDVGWVMDETGTATRSYVDGTRALTFDVHESSTPALFLSVSVVDPASLPAEPPPDPPDDLPQGAECDMPRLDESFAQFELRCPP
jgi:hypothetical protein